MEKLFVLAFLFLLPSIQCLPNKIHAHINLCNKTPYPQICNSLIISNVPPSLQESTLLAIRDSSLKITLDHALMVHGLVSSMDFSSFDKLAKVAWEDCLELYEDTIHEMNHTILVSRSHDHSITKDDIQTSLSAASTNLETCKDGFSDLNVPMNSKMYTFTSTNFSLLLTNALAINGALSTIPSKPYTWKRTSGVIGSGGHRRLLAHGIPSWMTKRDHKLIHTSILTMKVDLVVAKDGTGNYKTICEAIDATKHLRNGIERFIIHVKAGIYKENIVITKKMINLMLIGDGIDATIVTGNKNVFDGSTTFRSATFGISGNGFIAKGITFENTAGPQKHQAVALRSGSDFSIFYRCSFKGYQDTLYVHSKRQFYKECDIYGTVDFIFGNAAAVLQNCNIYARRPMINQMNTVTAQGRSDPNENTGIVIHGSIIEAAPDLKVVQGSFQTFLGRPWKMYSRTVVMKSNIDGMVDEAGWAPWNGDFALKTLYYGEYMNYGAGASTRGRVRWPGYHVISSPIEAGRFTVGRFLAGDKWIPASGVPFTYGL
ncbi:pectinesterase-like [Chenopodium quinoa]|nr:pectinesterase-like [Chenopodium quinoa]